MVSFSEKNHAFSEMRFGLISRGSFRSCYYEESREAF